MPCLHVDMEGVSGRKMVIGKTVQEFIRRGLKKFHNKEKEAEQKKYKLFLEDGTKIDEDDVLKQLAKRDVLHLAKRGTMRQTENATGKSSANMFGPHFSALFLLKIKSRSKIEV